MEKVVEEFIKAKEEGDSQKVKGLEVRYGKKTLERMSREWVVERESRRWLEENSTKCPVSSERRECSEVHTSHRSLRTDMQRIRSKINRLQPYDLSNMSVAFLLLMWAVAQCTTTLCAF